MAGDISAGSTSARTIKTQHKFVSSNGTTVAQHGGRKSYIWVFEIGA